MFLFIAGKGPGDRQQQRIRELQEDLKYQKERVKEFEKDAKHVSNSFTHWLCALYFWTCRQRSSLKSTRSELSFAVICEFKGVSL